MSMANEGLALAFAAEHPGEAARLLDRADPGDVAAVLSSMKPANAALVYVELGPSASAACTAAMPDSALSSILEALPLDAAVAALRPLEERRRETLLAAMDNERREHLQAMLSYAPNTVGAAADPLVLSFADDISVADAQRQLRGSSQHLLYYMYVVARDRSLAGAIALPELMAAPPRSALASVMRRDIVRLEAHADLAAVAALPAWRDLDALPVVDARGRLIGAVRHRSIRRMDLARERAMTATIVGLSELYWSGLAGILASFAPRTAATEVIDGS